MAHAEFAQLTCADLIRYPFPSNAKEMIAILSGPLHKREFALPDRPVLKVSDANAWVEPLYHKWLPKRQKEITRQMTFDFLARWHYMHRDPDASLPVLTRSFGLFVEGQMHGIVVFNTPAAGVAREKLYGTEPSPWVRRVISATRVCCSDPAPFNLASFMVSRAIRLLAELDDRFSVVIAQSDLAIRAPDGRQHVGTIYKALNAYYAGLSETDAFVGFYNQTTGAFKSRKTWRKTLSPAQCPPGYAPQFGRRLNNFLWFIGADAEEAKEALQEPVRVFIRQARELEPEWIRPVFTRSGSIRAYPRATDGPGIVPPPVSCGVRST